MAMQTLDVCALGLTSSQDYRVNLTNLIEAIGAHQKANLIVAPEVVLSGFDYPRIKEASEFSPYAIEQLKKVSHTSMVALTLIVEENGDFLNRAVVMYQNQVIFWRDKAKLFRLGKEHLYFKPGDEGRSMVFELEGVRYGVLICFELRFKELWRRVEGADVVIVPVWWGKERKEHLHILARALAVMNQCFVVVADSVEGTGMSMIISPNGVMQTVEGKGALQGRLDLKEVKKLRRYIVM